MFPKCYHKRGKTQIFLRSLTFVLHFVATKGIHTAPKREHKMSETEAKVETESEGAAIKLRIAPEFKAEIEAAAKARHISVAALVRLAVGDYLTAQRASREVAA